MDAQSSDRLRPRLALVACIGLGLLAMLAPRPADAAVFSNPTAIAIGAGVGELPSLYPSPIVVSGLSGTTTDVNVTIDNFSHTFPGDVSMVLVPPAGQTILLAQEAGGNPDAVNQTITFDDSAPGQIPQAGPLVTGSYRPTSYLNGPSFPAPGPGTGYCNPGPIEPKPFCTLASALDGAGPNGTWNLYVYDFHNANGGAIAGGWSLSVSVPPPVQPPAPPAADITAPTVTLGKKPPKKGPAHKVRFVFSSDEAGSSFQCKLDKGAFKACSSPFKKTVGIGSHSFEVRATDRAGNTGEAAKYGFRVVKKRTR
jgi:hypothetical protein